MLYEFCQNKAATKKEEEQKNTTEAKNKWLKQQENIFFLNYEAQRVFLGYL